jgi:hypothetical protein
VLTSPATTLTTTAGSRDLSLSTLTELVRVEAVEYPVGDYPASYVQFSTWAQMMSLLVDQTPSGAESVDVYWGSLHTVDGSGSTLPTALEDLAVLGAGGYAAVEWANYAANRANVAGYEAFRQYESWGNDALRRFREQLQTLAADNRVRATRLYAVAAEQSPSQSVVRWET